MCVNPLDIVVILFTSCLTLKSSLFSTQYIYLCILYCRNLGVCGYRRGMDWMGHLYTPLGAALYRLLTQTSVLDPLHPPLAAPWQRLLSREIL
jgi:hypothetical protein